MGSAPPRPPPVCAQCGADIPARAQACPACGADERTGWRESSLYDGLDLPDSAWDDDDATGDPLPAHRAPTSGRPGQLAWYWWATGLGLLIVLLLTFLGLR